eukprot:CAMPEP_0176335126 /NCGR_PEP_ID=MMETSP0121_2-20121125/78455_1 /TAXON_ID=160619 /ORGANISM="Kryptoperidinium foliaceum, Strain CCMP 1326" /LENGTH=46 /DNA_ID= /DNA_START= /DNA_END= /DNA_ORIENTATION=
MRVDIWLKNITWQNCMTSAAKNVVAAPAMTVEPMVLRAKLNRSSRV